MLGTSAYAVTPIAEKGEVLKAKFLKSEEEI
jgi:hypothetical protein